MGKVNTGNGGGTYGAPFVWQQGWDDEASAVACSVTLGLASYAGNYIFVFFREVPGSAKPTISDSARNTWSVIYTEATAGFWYCLAKTYPVGNVIQVAPIGAHSAIRVVEVTNIINAPSFAASNGTSATLNISLNGVSVSYTFEGTDTPPVPWAACMIYFAGVSGSLPFVLLGMEKDSSGDSWNLSLPDDWLDLFPGTEIGNGADSTYLKVLSYAPQLGVTLAAVLTDICERSGMPSSQIDTSLVTLVNVNPTDLVMGYVIDRLTPAKTVLDALLRAYFLDAVETNGTIKFVPRGLPAQITIPSYDLGLVKDLAEIEEQIAQEQDLPLSMTVTYNDPTIDYQQNKAWQTRNSRQVSSTQQATLEIPLTFLSSWAQQTAVKALYLAWLERNSYKFNTWRAIYSLIDSTDVVVFDYENLKFQIRTVDMTVGQGLAVAISGVSEAAEVLNSAATGSAGSIGGNPLLLLEPTTLFLFDIPLLKDTDSNPDNTGYYFAVASILPTWRSGILYSSTDDTNFSVVQGSAYNTTYGFAKNILGSPVTAWTWDTVNTLTVTLAGGSFLSDTNINVLNGKNVVLVGNEIIQFTTAVQNSDGTWTLSNLLRGRRGTEWACGSHTENELVIVPQTGFSREQEPLAVVGQPRWYEAVTTGQDPSTVEPVPFTITGQDLVPYAPCHLGGTVNGNGDITILWTRRTRVGWNSLSQDPVPLSEDNELYVLNILSPGKTNTVVRTFSNLAQPTCIYTAALQITDFGALQPDVVFSVAQISSQVGPGNVSIGIAPTPGGWPILAPAAM